MACDPPNQEWTIDMLIDNQPEETKRRLVFCLAINDGKVSGEVRINTMDGVAVHLSSVTGHSQVLAGVEPPDPARPPTLLTVTFTWGPRTIVLAGNTVTDEELNKFSGRFFAFDGPAMPVNEPPGGGGIPEAPGEGDTGTGNGTQT